MLWGRMMDLSIADLPEKGDENEKSDSHTPSTSLGSKQSQQEIVENLDGSSKSDSKSYKEKMRQIRNRNIKKSKENRIYNKMESVKNVLESFNNSNSLTENVKFFCGTTDEAKEVRFKVHPEKQ